MGSKIYQFACNSKTTRRAKLKFGHNVSAYKGFMRTEFGSTHPRDRNFIGRESAKTWTNWEAIFLDKYRYWCRTGARGAFFGPVPPKSLLVLPQARNVPHKRGLCSKKKQKTRCHWSALRGLCPPKYCLCPPSVSKGLVPERKIQLNAKTKPKILRPRRKPFFWFLPLNL